MELLDRTARHRPDSVAARGLRDHAACDLGADVVKVEEPRAGDYMRDMFPIGYEVLNRNKRSIAWTSRPDEGRALLTRLAQSADVLVENFRPGVADRLGVGYDASAPPRTPSRLLCGLRVRPERSLRLASGHDINYQSVTGMSHLHADPTGPPHHGRSRSGTSRPRCAP